MPGSNDNYRVFIVNAGAGAETIAGISTRGPEFGVSIDNDVTTRNVSAIGVSCNTLTVSDTINGNLDGNVIGNFTGNLTGNVTGNLTGNVTGNVSGSSGSLVLTSPDGTQYRITVTDDGALGTVEIP